MQEAAAAVADFGMNAPDFGIFPVVSEFHLTAHSLLCFTQSSFQRSETITGFIA